MIYITTMQHKKPRQLTWEDVFSDKVFFNDFAKDISNCTSTITRKFYNVDDKLLEKIDVTGMIAWLKKFNEDNKNLFEVDRASLYYSFKIPKKTGGFRQIDAPNDDLQYALKRLVTFIKDDCGVLYHTAAFAYIPGRSINDCVQKHQRNNSEWFLKTDFSGFFPSTTLDFVMNMFSMIFPLSEICKVVEGEKELRKALSLAFLNGGLPQGTTASPDITNIMMIPIDHKLFNTLANRKIVYTRYADDIHISAEKMFPWEEIVQLIKDTLNEFNAPFVIKDEKTHFGRKSGKSGNWNLGLMLNMNNDITVGWKKKNYFKCALNSFILDTKNKKYWDIGDVSHLRGQLAFYKMIEPEYFKQVVYNYNKKWKVNVNKMFKDYMSGNIA